MDFLRRRWNIEITPEAGREILGLEFVNDGREIPPDLPNEPEPPQDAPETRTIVPVTGPDIRRIAASTMADFLGVVQRPSDVYNNQVRLMQSGNMELFLRFTNDRPHVTFNVWVYNAAAFASRYGAGLSEWGNALGFRVNQGRSNGWGNGVQFKPNRVVDIENLDREALKAMGNLVIEKLRETIG